MHIISLKTVRAFWETYPDAEQPLRAWYAIARHAQWRTPSEIRAIYGSASFVGNNRVVFNIKGMIIDLLCWRNMVKGNCLFDSSAPMPSTIGLMPVQSRGVIR